MFDLMQDASSTRNQLLNLSQATCREISGRMCSVQWPDYIIASPVPLRPRFMNILAKFDFPCDFPIDDSSTAVA